VGAELFALCQSITEDGSISKEELLSLRSWIVGNRNASIPAVEFLSNTMERIVADRRVTQEEMNELYDALVKVMPPESREEAELARNIVTEERTDIGSAGYLALAMLFRKSKRFDAEVRILERCLKQQQANPYYRDLTGGEWTEKIEDRLIEARVLLEGYERYGPEGKGKCEHCGKAPRKLYRLDTGLWVCITCRKQLCPPRPPHLASKTQLKRLGKLGFAVSDDMSKEQADRTVDMHTHVTYYVFDAWEILTGNRPKYQLGYASALDQFVTSLFHESSLVQRIVALQERRDRVAYSKMTEEQLDDPYRYVHLAATKPPLRQDADFQYVAQRLRQEYPQFVR